ncbi:amino acid adenylation domain-containing protein [Paenibacillus sambharensis]|uniref:amino acid adenylation domain-containing protein n=1 Tax=Paenibacillus sambharensis TaxID=1803190 RepID=UPI0015E87933|nr:amino acid adenylation domain-containing protein [Paenibacillus sambharensis]
MFAPRQRQRFVPELILSQAGNTPDATAVVCGDEVWSYRRLEERSNQIARQLLRAGVKEGAAVALLIRRSPDLLAAMIAVMRTGGYYIPVDPHYPDERIRHMIEDSQAVYILADEAGRHPRMSGIETIVTGLPGSSPDEGHIPAPVTAAEDLAYVIYTSGSTGMPKGVMIGHGALLNFLEGIVPVLGFAQGKSIVSLTTVSFDIFVLETLVALCCGMKVIMATEEEQNNPRLLRRLLATCGADMLQTTPSRLHMMMSDRQSVDMLQGLQRVFIGGEMLQEKLVRRFRSMSGARLYNLYGPTEATVWCAVKEITDSGEINIGQPLRNMVMTVRDERHKALPRGSVGELYVAGAGLSSGYWNRPELTEERFVCCEGSDGRQMRFYRTGDLALQHDNDEFEVLGRMDDQVKIRGNRVELGEVEAALLQHPQIVQAAAAIEAIDEFSRKLVVFYVSGVELAADELKSLLYRSLPDYMVPASYRRVKRMPLTPNGKLDRRALVRGDWDG